MEFQKLFEEVMTRARRNFVRVRPYGQMGDWKCDGFLLAEATIFQVYSPDLMRKENVRAKIREDLDGAVKQWGDKLKMWVFVYNERRGLPPDVAGILDSEIEAMKERHSHLTIEAWSSDHLWQEILRELPIQDRTEILGPPPGCDVLFPLTATLPEEIQERPRDGKFMVVQDIMSPINLQDAVRALAPAKPFAPPLIIRFPEGVSTWDAMAEHQRATIGDALSRSRENLPRFAVFSLSPIPLAIHLGYLLSDKVEVLPFQYDRDRKTWSWDTEAKDPDMDFIVSGRPEVIVTESIEIAIRISLSARIRPDETEGVTGILPVVVDIETRHPDVMWLTHPDQIMAFMKVFRGVLGDIRALVPNCKCIHLFYAGPTGCAVAAGQAINPRMNPPVQLYEYHRGNASRYSAALKLV